MTTLDRTFGAPVAHVDLRRLAKLLAAAPRAPSEYSLANLVLYRTRHDYRLVDGDLPFILGETYDGERHALPLCPLDVATADRLLEHASCIYPLGEGEAQALCAAGAFRIDACDADADYVYDAAQLASLRAARVKRAQAAKFAGLDPRLAPFDAVSAHQVLAGWIADASRGPDHADARECAEAIERAAELELEGVSVFLQDIPVGFLLAGPARQGERTVHFAKGRRAHAGVYPWMFARFAGLAGADRLNFEQDLGNPGLAQSKRALAPMGRISKFRLRKA